MTAAQDSRLDGRGVSAKREASRVGRFAMEEVREWWARTSPAMQQMRGILHQGGGPIVDFRSQSITADDHTESQDHKKTVIAGGGGIVLQNTYL